MASNRPRRDFEDVEKGCRYATVYDPIAVGSIDGTDKVPHDRAIARAMESEYKPDPSIKSNPACTLFVARLHPKATEEELVKIFSEYGPVLSCRVVRDIITGCSKQYAFVEFQKQHHADAAYKKGHKRMLHATEMLVDWEYSRTMKDWKPRRLGGGFGGRKESGQLRFGCRDRPWRAPILPHSSKTNR